jgi:hypothetical protein
MDWHEKQINQSLRHANEHRNNIELRTKDLSCRVCYPVNEELMSEDFNKFWEWYQGITSAEKFSAKAENIFKELMKKNTENILEGRENIRINALIYSIRYRNNSNFTVKDIRARIVNMIIISEKFTRDMEEAAESYKTNSSKENSSKEGSPRKRDSPKIKGSKDFEKETLRTKLEGSEENIEEWDTSTEELMNEEEIKRRWRDIELRKLRKLEEAKDLEEIESIKSEENPYSSGIITPTETIEEFLESTKNSSEPYRKLIKEKYKKLKEKFGEELNVELIKQKEDLHKRIKEKEKYLEEKEILTEKEEKELSSIKKGENIEIREFLLEALCIEHIYKQYIEEEEEDFELDDNEEIQEKIENIEEIKEQEEKNKKG